MQWQGRLFQIPPQPKRFSFAGDKVQIYESLEGEVSIYYANTKLHHAVTNLTGVTFSSGR